MKTEKKPCIKCLLRDLDEAGININIEKYIQIIKASERAGDELYEQRLAVCKECRSLISGSCMKCGCYVEIRAAMKSSHCPDVPSKW